MVERFEVSTDARLTTVPITDRVATRIPAGFSGTCTVYSQHTTTGVIVNENESRLREDVAAFLGGLVADEGWEHDRIDDNADAHLRATLLGPDVTVPVEDGELALGTWQEVMLVECDGPRTRTVLVQPTPGRS